MESRTVVAKRREKPAKIEQRKVSGPEWGPQVKQTALLASPNYIGQVQEEEKKTYKKRSQNWAGGFSSHLLGWPAFIPRGCILRCFLNKTELQHRAVTWSCNTGPSEGCNTGLSLQIFVVMRQIQGNYRLSQHLWCHFLDLTWLKKLQHSPHKEEAKHSRSPTPWKLPLWKMNVKKTQCRWSDKKPSTLEMGTLKNKLSRKLTRLSLKFQKISGLGRRSSLLWLEGHMPNKILFPLQSLISCFLEAPWTSKWQWVQLRDSGEATP